MAFVETFSLFVLHDLPWAEDGSEDDIREVFESMWRDLRHGVMYFMRYDEGQHTPERILAAQNSLMSYAKQAEEVRLLFPRPPPPALPCSALCPFHPRS